MTPEEMKNELGRLFGELKSENDKRLAAIEAKGAADPLSQEKLTKINTALSELEAKLSARADEIERKANRAALGEAGGDPRKSEAKASFLSAIRRGEERMGADERKALVISSDTGGGYLAPAEIVMEIVKAEVLYSPVRSIVRVRPTGSAEVVIPKRTGTASATRVGETQTRNETQNPSWGAMKISAPEMYAETRVTFADLEDSAFNLEQLIIDEFGEQFGVKEGAEFVSGNGINQMLGILDANAAGVGVPLAYTASGQAATIAGAAAGSAGQGDPLVNLIHAVKTAYARNGSWILNRNSLGKIRLLKDTTGKYLWDPGLNGGAAPTILNAPYVECPDMPDEGANAFPIGFGDWKRGYTMVDRVELAITRDPYTIASSGQVKISARKRVGGQVVLGEAMRLLKCATS